MNFYLSDGLMQNKEKNPENAKYNTVYDGTINMNTVLMAQAIGTKGHFYQIAEELKPFLPKIVDHEGNEVTAVKSDDDTWLGIEHYSGVVVQARMRL